eukprot:GHVN01087713.1.p3 GENE.GHVN01087713.1~~GHVN01087713.1.p3  ORF type:complete len:108 (-),score=16.13 GHVN01087713.1:18-341(-)
MWSASNGNESDQAGGPSHFTVLTDPGHLTPPLISQTQSIHITHFKYLSTASRWWMSANSLVCAELRTRQFVQINFQLICVLMLTVTYHHKKLFGSFFASLASRSCLF